MRIYSRVLPLRGLEILVDMVGNCDARQSSTSGLESNAAGKTLPLFSLYRCQVRWMSRKPKLKKMRCFVGLRFTLHEPLAELMADLKICTMEPNIRLRIYSPEDLHITLKFLGSVTEDRLLSIQSSLSLLAANCHPLNLQCRGIGVFKNSLWIGIETDRYLSLITSQLDEAFAILGCSREQRPYTPHITLARFNREQKARITLLQEKYAGQRWGALKAGKLYLYRSDTLAEGARYTILKGYTLSALP